MQDLPHGLALKESSLVPTHRRTFAFGLGCALLGPTAGYAATTGDEPVGHIEHLRGTATVLKGLDEQPLGTGDALQISDIVRTGADGRVVILIRGGLRVTVGSDTELVLRTYLQRPEQGRLAAVFTLLRGIVRLISGEGTGRHDIEIESRTAIASVRATEWIVETSETNTGVLALLGEVRVTGYAGGAVVLRPGEGTDVRAAARPTPPAPWGQPRRTSAIARTTF